MAKVLYGVAGQGYGHSSRSEVIGKQLIKSGHKVMFAASQKSLQYLRPIFRDCVKDVYGLRLVYSSGQLLPLRTLLRNVVGYPKGFVVNVNFFSKHVREFKPDLVISDFEPFTAWWAYRNRVPCLSIDHQHLVTLSHDDNDMRSFKDSWMTKLIINSYNPFSDAYLIMNFFEIPMKKRGILVPPVIRDAAKRIQSTAGESIVVYTTDTGDAMRREILKSLGSFSDHKFIIYGFDESCIVGNCLFKETSTKTFLQDLAASRGVIASAGFSLICECLYFKKPMLLIPIKSQYEQILNSIYVERLGLGIWAKSLTISAVRSFLERHDYQFQHDPRLIKPNNESFFSILSDVSRNLGVPLVLCKNPSDGQVSDSMC